MWLNAHQIAKLFDRDVKTIRKHINNVLKEELNDYEAVANFASTTKHGTIEGKTQTHMIKYYNLDVIISVGYRIKSKNEIIFRKWANGVLKNYLLKGYAINQKKLEYLEKTVKLIDIAGRIDHEFKGNEAGEIIKVINNYSNALNLLDDYDHKTVTKPKGTIKTLKIKYDDCINIINKLKFCNNSTLFALEKDKELLSIIENVYASYDNVDVYPSIEEKAANFLYLIIKSHPFIDGNKRIPVSVFIYFFNYYNLLYKNDKQVIQ